VVTLFSRHLPLRSVLLWMSEAGLIVSVVWAAFYWRGVPFDGAATGSVGGLRIGIAVALLCQLSLYYHDLYGGARCNPTWDSCLRILQSIALAAVAVAGLSMLFRSWRVGPAIILALSVLPFALIVWRIAYAKLAYIHAFDRKILLIGTSRLAEDLVAALNAAPQMAYTIGDRLPDLARVERRSVPRPGAPSNVLDLVRHRGLDHVVIALDDSRGKLPIEALLQCKFSGVPIEHGLSFYEKVTGKVHLDALRPSWLIFSDGFRRHAVTAFIKRTLDVAVAVVGLSITLPLGLVLALLIKLDSPGPVFYRQERFGQGERPFSLIKFRSMRADAEEVSGPVWAKDQDDRVTRVGRWLRLFRLDELPQMVNVLRGEMSFVGPRPERPCFVATLKAKIPYYGFRHAVRPGITGWAQVRYRYGASLEDTIEKLQYDLCYLKNMSLFWDLSILVDTVKIMLQGRGAR
jgi:sugar transferase (PEP-CTERM system associated)